MVEQIDYDFNLEELRKIYFFAERNAQWSQTFPTVQSGIQTSINDDSDYLSSCKPGILSKDEKNYLKLHRLYQKSYLEEFIANAPLKICRLRWMVLNPKSCYSLHKDGTKRIHIPVISNPQCYMIFQGDGEFYHLQEGKCYLVDTTKPHTAMNGGEELRIHLVGCIYE